MPAADPRPDLAAFARDLDELLERTRAGLGPEDLAHLAKIERWGRLSTLVGWATAALGPNPLSMVLLALGRVARWAMVAHHVSHKGYDRVPGVAEVRTSRVFARGARRFVDWLDWLDLDAWAHEHNKLHHYRLGETSDPDLVEQNLDWLRSSRLPMPVRYAIVAFFACTWKLTYYAPNTLRAVLEDERRRRGESGGGGDTGEGREPPSLAGMFLRPELWRRCILPYALVQFVVLPACFLPFGLGASLSALACSFGAELLANLHAFAIITTNHAGEDLEAFDGPVTGGKAEFYYRQVVGSTNFRTGTDAIDFLQGFLNYQIEHHLFPDLPMRAYQRIQPEVKAICARHGVRYVQEPVFTRLKKTLDVMVGKRSMRRSTDARSALAA